ncbi:hypothetical protein [Treponema pectinovorum]|uniref:hypothetical protein n=1 Tax=Treponema pectinovorum TaxID=164 RepID=UPI0011CB5D65|nr:hypothetical protein [Treponema pectinovorum]
MELFVNGQKLDIQLENEKTVGDVLKSFETECEKTNATTVSIVLNGKNVYANDFEESCKEELKEDTKIELEVISQTAIEQSFNELKDEAKKISEELKSISVKLQSGKDKEVSVIITSLADFIDRVCHTASLATLFPKRFGSIKIEDKNFSQFFAEFSPVLKDFEAALTSKDTVMLGDLAEYEISPRLDKISLALEE